MREEIYSKMKSKKWSIINYLRIQSLNKFVFHKIIYERKRITILYKIYSPNTIIYNLNNKRNTKIRFNNWGW